MDRYISSTYLLCLPLLRKLPGCGGILPNLEQRLWVQAMSRVLVRARGGAVELEGGERDAEKNMQKSRAEARPLQGIGGWQRGAGDGVVFG